MRLLDAEGEASSVETVVHVAGPSAVNAENMNAPDTPDVNLPVDVVQELQQKIALLEQKVANCEEIINELKNENKILLEQQFSLDKIKDDDSAILFYTGFPSYQSLMSFYSFIEPKLSKMQYWKGQHLVRESQPYQDDEHHKKPGPSRKLTFLDEFLLVLMRLKAGLFVQDLAD